MTWQVGLIVGCAALLAMAAVAQDDPLAGLETLARDGITVRFPAGSEDAAERVAEVCAGTRAYLAPLFGLQEDFPLTVLWVERERWPRVTRLEFGFPSNSGRGEVLPAVDRDRPDGLAKLTWLLDLDAAPPEMAGEFRELLGLYPDTPAAAVNAVIEQSVEFNRRYVINFILPHEICHAMNNAAQTPREPWWIHEFQAQGAAIMTCRELGLEGDARLFELYYRLMYLGGRERVEVTDVLACSQQSTGMGIVNYAWYHGALVEIFHEIEERSDEGFGERLLALARDRATGRQQVTGAEFIALMSAAAGEDLSGWLAERWGLR